MLGFRVVEFCPCTVEFLDMLQVGGWRPKHETLNQFGMVWVQKNSGVGVEGKATCMGTVMGQPTPLQ